MASSMAWFWSLPLTVDLVSPNLGVRQAFIVLGNGADGLALAQTGSLQFDAVRGVNDAVQDRVPAGGIPDDFMPATHRNLASDQQRAGLVSVVDGGSGITPGSRKGWRGTILPRG